MEWHFWYKRSCSKIFCLQLWQKFANLLIQHKVPQKGLQKDFESRVVSYLLKICGLQYWKVQLCHQQHLISACPFNEQLVNGVNNADSINTRRQIVLTRGELDYLKKAQGTVSGRFALYKKTFNIFQTSVILHRHLYAFAIRVQDFVFSLQTMKKTCCWRTDFQKYFSKITGSSRRTFWHEISQYPSAGIIPKSN